MSNKRHPYSASSSEFGAPGMDRLMKELSAQAWVSPIIRNEDRTI